MQINGRLVYMGPGRSCILKVHGKSELDLWPMIKKFIVSLNGKGINYHQTHDEFVLSMSKTSCFILKCITKSNTVLTMKRFKNRQFITCDDSIVESLNHVLCFLSGRLVKINIENGKQMSLVADESEKVFGVYSINDTDCEVPPGYEKTICKVSGPDRCIFLFKDVNGFICHKFDFKVASIRLGDLDNGNIGAGNRIGNCKLLWSDNPRLAA